MKQFEKTVYVSHKYGGDKNSLKEVEEIIKTQQKKTSELYVYFTDTYVWLSVQRYVL